MAAMTITRALAELKLLDKRIRKKVGDVVLIDLHQNRTDRAIQSGMTKNEFQTEAQSGFKSIEALIVRRRHIKSRVLESNSTNRIEVAGQLMTIAEAIDRKNTIEYEKLLLQKMILQSAGVRTSLERQRLELETKVGDMLRQSLGTEKASKKEDFETIAAPFLDANMYRELDPINIKTQIEKYDRRVDEFLTEIDFMLSESNAKTTIIVGD